MKKDGTMIPADGKQERDTVYSIKNHLLNRILLFSMMSSVIMVITAVSRAWITGFKFVYVVQVSLAALVSLLFFLRNRMSYNIRLVIFIPVILAVGAAGYLSVGLLGYATLVLVFAVVVSAAFASPPYSVLGFGAATAILLIFAVLYTRGVFSLSFDLQAYHRSFLAWINYFTGFVVLAGLLASIITSLVGNLSMFARQSQDNISQIRLLNETLNAKVAERTAELVRSNGEKDRILGIVAHDISNKLVGVVGYLDLLYYGYDHHEDEARKRYMKIAMNECLGAKEIVQELLEFSRSFGEQQPMPVETVDLCPFVRSTIDSHLPRALEKNIQLTMENTLRYAFCDINRTKLSRVMDNLVTNALKFTNEGGRVSVVIEEDGRNIAIKIADNGIGIPDALQSNVFRPFSSSGRPGTAGEKSTGIGLSIAAGIVEQHHGKLWFESEEGEGTTFYLRLPAAENDGAENGSSSDGMV
jgi:signal transduction histidine kinase